MTKRYKGAFVWAGVAAASTACTGCGRVTSDAPVHSEAPHDASFQPADDAPADVAPDTSSLFEAGTCPSFADYTDAYTGPFETCPYAANFKVLLRASDMGTSVVFVGVRRNFVTATRATDVDAAPHGRESFLIQYLDEPPADGRLEAFQAYALPPGFAAFQILTAGSNPLNVSTAYRVDQSWLAVACDSTRCSLFYVPSEGPLVPTTYPDPPRADYTRILDGHDIPYDPQVGDHICLGSANQKTCLQDGAWVDAPNAPSPVPDVCCPIAPSDFLEVWVNGRGSTWGVTTKSGYVFTDEPVRYGTGACCSYGTFPLPVAADAFSCGINPNLRLLTADALFGTVGCAID